jgi:tetratricopeptide (TPR) repeat protein
LGAVEKKQVKSKCFVAKVKEVELMSESEATLRTAIELNPDRATAYYNLGLLLAQDPVRVSEAAAAYRKAIELDPDNARYVYRLALLLHENLHDLEEAEVAYRQAIALAPEDPFYYGGLISLLVQQSRRAEALPLSEKMRARLIARENWYGLTTLESILGNVEVAIEYLRQAARQMNFDQQWARNDPDLSSIRDDPRFDEIIDNL